MDLNIFVIVNLLCSLTISAAFTGLAIVTETNMKLINFTQPMQTSKIVDDANGGAIELLYEDGLVCWSNVRFKNLQCKSRVSSRKKILYKNNGVPPGGLACDWYTKKLYWINNDERLIGVTSIDDSHTKILFWQKMSELRSIAVAPKHKYLFWIDWNHRAKIERASMDGDQSSRRVIASDDLHSPFALTIDYEYNLIYYSEPQSISSMDFDGKNQKKIKSGISPTILSYMDHTFYWINSQDQHVEAFDERLQKITIKSIFSKQLTYDLKVWDPKRQKLQDNPCRHSNGRCSHLCLLSSTSWKNYTCACPTGILLKNEYECAPFSKNTMLVSQMSKILKISLDTPDYTKLLIPVKGVRNAVDVDYDPMENKLYWSDDRFNVIKRTNFGGTFQEDIITSRIGSLNALSVDLVGRNLYWLDSKNRRIEMSRLDGTRRKVIISSVSVHLRAMIAEPMLGYLFWTDCDNFAPKIERAHMDGLNRITLVSQNIEEPNSLAVDWYSQRLFWSDSKTNVIEAVDINGSNRKIIVKNHSGNINSVGVVGDHVYWYNSNENNIQRADKVTGTNHEVIVKELRDVTRFKIIQPGVIPTVNYCMDYNGDCEHFCISKPNKSNTCACEVAYELAEDKKSCKLSEAYFLYSTSQTFGKINLNSQHETIPTRSIQDVKDFDVNVASNIIYYIERIGNKSVISQMYVNGSNAETVIHKGLVTPSSVAFDWLSNNLYWTDIGLNKIKMVKLPNGNYEKVVLSGNLKGPRSLVLDPQQGVMYWIDNRYNGSILAANLDGSNKRTITTNIGFVHNMIVDTEENVLYWSNHYAKYIETYDLNQNKRSILVNNVSPNTLTIYKDRLFWMDLLQSVIESVNKTDGSDRREFLKPISRITKLFSVHPSRQSGWNSCKIQNGNCSQLCIGFPIGKNTNNSICACDSHFTLNPNNTTCSPPQHYLIYSQYNSIGRIVPTSESNLDVILYEQNMERSHNVVFDPLSNYVFYINDRYSIIQSHNGKIQTYIIDDPSNHPFDIALDIIGRILYWSCSLNNTINAYQVDRSTSIGFVIKNSREKPRHLAVHSEKRMLFWTDFGDPFGIKIIQSKVDGNGRFVIAKNLNAPTAFTVDTTSDTVYWAQGDKIETSNLYGKHRKILVHIDPYVTTSLAVCLDQVYWYNKRSSTIERIDKSVSSIRSTIFIVKMNVTGLVAVNVPSYKVLRAHSCSQFNSYYDCSHFCIGNKKLVCACPFYLNLSDDSKTCESLLDCGPNYFTCEVSKNFSQECVHSTWLCDNLKDCSDGSDEVGCFGCLRNQYRCSSKKCIDESLICNGVDDCEDAEDKRNCCKNGFFKCNTTNVCLSPKRVCDKWKHCADGSDEKPPVCPIPERPPPPERKYKIFFIGAGVILMFGIIFVWLVFSPGENETVFNRQRLRVLEWLANIRRPSMVANEPPSIHNENEMIMMERLPDNNLTSDESPIDRFSNNEDSSIRNEESAEELMLPSNTAASVASTSSTVNSNIRLREMFIRRFKYKTQPFPDTPYNTQAESDSPEPISQKVTHSNTTPCGSFSSSEFYFENTELKYRPPHPSPTTTSPEDS